MNRFKKGQEVVCIDENFPNKLVLPLKNGCVYTCEGYDDDGVHIFIKEIGEPYCYHEKRFEPVKYDYCTKELAQTMVEHLGGEKKEEVEHIKIKR